MIQRERELADQVARNLAEAGIRFDRDVSLGGIQPDLIAYSPDDRTFIIEVKAWQKHRGFRNRAAHQADLYRETTGADEAFVVVDNLERSSAPEGVVTLDRLVPALIDAFSRRPTVRKELKPVSRSRRPHVFAAMPFDREYDDVFFVAMTYAAELAGAVCKRVDIEEFSGDMVSEIHVLIRRSIATIVDLSESRPNVLYEAGYAHALAKPIVHICSTPLGELPFDVAHWNTLPYDQGQTFRLRDTLANRLGAVLSKSKNRRLG